ncbi:MAG: EthD domain-containing protein [Gammaproteobacteria bacterium]|nr:EthD domain-containing protein [Gammaproteobacteria bacterium]
MNHENTAPLIVLNALVLRADSSPPEGVRAARPRYNVNRAGQGIEDAETADRTLALTDRPQLEWEAYDEYWRKVHGPKILHSDGPDDVQTPLLQFYLQQHRVPSGPSSEYAPPYGALPGPDGTLVRDPAARCKPPVRPAWDGLAQLAYRTKEDVARFFDLGPGKYGEKIVPDEAVFLRGFGFHLAEEHVIFARGEQRRDPIIMIRCHSRRAGSSRAEFRARWLGAHAALVAGLAGSRMKRYVQLHNVSTPNDRLYDPVGDRYDGVAIQAFANMNDLEDYLSSEAYARVAADEREFAGGTSYFTALNYVIKDIT